MVNVGAMRKAVFPAVGPAVCDPTRGFIWQGAMPWTPMELANAILWMADINPIVGGATTLKESEKVHAYSTDAIPFGTDDFSIEFKIKPSSMVEGTVFRYTVTGGVISVYFSANGLYVGFSPGSGSYKRIAAVGVIVNGSWAHVVVNFNRTTGIVTAFVNSVEQSSDTFDISAYASAFGTTSPVGAIGGKHPLSDNLSAEIEYLRIRVGGLLSESEISWLHNGGNGRTSADLALIGDEPYMDVDFNRPDTSLADYPPIDRSGNTDWIFVASNMLANPGFETLTGWTGKNLIATQKAGYAITPFDPGTSDWFIRAKIKLTSVDLAEQIIITTGAQSNGTDGLMVCVTLATLTVRMNDSVQATRITHTFGNTFVVGTDYDICVNADRNGNLEAFVNGTSIGTVDISGHQATLGNQVTSGIGGFVSAPNAYSPFNGKLGLVKYGLGLLTAADIAQGNLPASAATYESATPVHAWDMNDRDSTGTIVDSEGSNDGTAAFGNLVVNGTFTGDSDWTKDASWTLPGTVASNDGSALDYLTQNCGMISGDTYSVAGDVTNYTGTGFVGLSSATGVRTGTSQVNGNGSINASVVSNGSDLAFNGSTAATHDLDNIVVKATVIKTISDADLYANWAESTSGTSRIHAETVDVDAGTYSARLEEGSGGDAASISQAILTVGNGYAYTINSQASAAGQTYNVNLGSGTTIAETADNGAYGEETGSGVCAGSTSFEIETLSATGEAIWIGATSVLATTVGIANGSAVSSVLDSGPLGNDGVLSGMGIDAFSTDVAVSENTTGGLSLTFDGTDDEALFGNIGNVTAISAYVKLPVDNQEILSLARSAVTAVSVAAGVLTFGGSLTVLEISVDDAVVNAAAAGVALNDNAWHKLDLTLTSFAASAFTLGGDGTAFGNVMLDYVTINGGATGEWGFEDFSMGLPPDNTPVLALVSYDSTRTMVTNVEPTARPAYRATGVGGRACLEFGGDDSLSVAIPASLNTSENGTLDFVFNADSTGTDEVLCSLSLSSADDTFVTIVLNGGELEFTYSDSGTVRSLATTTASLQAETDYAIRFTSDGSTISCFINNSEYALSGDQPGSWFDSLPLDTLTFGACVLSTGTTGFYEGRIAFISLSTFELTAKEKTELDLYLSNRYRL